MSEFAEMVRAELVRAREKFKATDVGYRHGKPHYFYAVILEELEEFWELVRSDAVEKDSDGKLKMLKELVQIAAMAQRAAEDMGLSKPEWFEEDLECGKTMDFTDQIGDSINTGPCVLRKGHSGFHTSGKYNWVD